MACWVQTSLLRAQSAAQLKAWQLSCLQFFTVGVLCLGPALLLEQPSWQGILAAALPILYAGVLSSGVAYTLQIVGQKYAEPTVAALSMSLESVFAALGGWLCLQHELSAKEFLGCTLMFLAILLAQLPSVQTHTRKQEYDDI